jgi:hypothetical protein
MKLKKEDKKPQPKKVETKQPEKPAAASPPPAQPQKKEETEKFDLITIVSSEDKEIPEQAPPFDEIFYDFIPESEQRQTASKDDHVSNAE